VLEAGSSVLLSVISIVFLARVLTPNDYGEVATGQFISGLTQLVLSVGISESIIQKKNLKKSDVSSALFGTFFLGLFGAIICLFFAIFFYSEKNHTLTYIMFFESLCTFLTIFILVPSALLMRNLEMKAFTQRFLISRVLFFIIAIPLALNSFGLWSIVYANLFQVLISFVLIFHSSRKYLPNKINFNLYRFISLIKFGFFIMLENLLWNVMTRFFGLMIASFHGAAALGIYNMATRLADSVLNVLNTIITRMALPVFSSVQEDRRKLLFSFQSATLYFNIISMPIFVCMAITADYWVPMVLGEKWNPIIPVLQIVSIMYSIMYSRMFVGMVVKAVGHSKDFLYLSLSSAAITILAAFVTRNLTLEDTIFAFAFPRLLVTIPLGIYLLKKICNFSVYSQISPLNIPVVMTFIIAILIYLTQYTMKNFSPTFSFFIQTFVGVFTFLGMFLMLFKLGKLSIVKPNNKLG